MSLLACNAQQVRHGGAVTQPAARPIGPGCMDTPAKHTAKIEVTGYGWHAILLIDAATTLPLAVEVGPMDAPETHWNRPSAR